MIRTILNQEEMKQYNELKEIIGGYYCNLLDIKKDLLIKEAEYELRTSFCTIITKTKQPISLCLIPLFNEEITYQNICKELTIDKYDGIYLLSDGKIVQYRYGKLVKLISLDEENNKQVNYEIDYYYDEDNNIIKIVTNEYIGVIRREIIDLFYYTEERLEKIKRHIIKYEGEDVITCDFTIMQFNCIKEKVYDLRKILLDLKTNEITRELIDVEFLESDFTKDKFHYIDKDKYIKIYNSNHVELYFNTERGSIKETYIIHKDSLCSLDK